MTYEEFKKELYATISRQEFVRGKEIRLLRKGSVCTDEKELSIVKVINLSSYGSEDIRLHEDVVYARWGSKNAIKMLYWPVRPLFERFKKEGWQSVLPQMAAGLQKEEKKIGEEQISSRLIVRPLNNRIRESELENGIYWSFGDIALVLYALLADSDSDFVTVKINRSALDKWKLPENLVLTNALLNTCALMPPRLYHGRDIRCSYEKDEGVFMKGEAGKMIQIHRGNEYEGMHGYRLTNSRGINGAVALFYPGVKERLAQLLGGDYFVGFTGIHEAVIHPVQHKVLGEMKAALHHTNAVFDKREMLTDKVYRYLSARKELIEV
ncbi:MAG: hypothetical protein E7287_07660 [Lachnospiraceae bacterium]|nr:hypothetical protein [Lachnospiraceae bacterium]